MIGLRIFFFGAGAFVALLALGFLLDEPWATWTWPFYAYRMSRIFIASILLAVAAPVILIGATREWAAIRGGAINLFVMFTIMSVYALATATSKSVILFGIFTGGFALFQAGLFLATRRVPFKDIRPTPRPVLLSFAGFTLVLIAVGLALLLNVEDILPWWVDRNLSVLYGAVFLGAATYFVHGMIVPVWGAARGQLAGFLAYDLVLIGPFLMQLPTVQDRYKLSLSVYTFVVVYSGVLAAYYLWRGPDPKFKALATQRLR